MSSSRDSWDMFDAIETRFERFYLELSDRSHSLSGFERDDQRSRRASDGMTSEKKPALPAGRLPPKVYDFQLPAYRARWRRRLLKQVEWETPILARWQARMRHQTLDIFFLWTAALGSHTAFLLGLPLMWWFGDGTEGRPLLYALALGVYWSSFLKDALCLPRPFSPPLTRLSIGNHALEYGWPSTHSTTASSTSLSLAFIVLPRLTSSLSTTAWSLGLFLYAISVMLGRLYSGMHSIIDCVTGSLLGLFISTAVYILTPTFDTFCSNPSAVVPLTLIPTALSMVTFLPQPIDNCPCFEDAVAFIAVVLGIALGYHWSYRVGYRPDMALHPFQHLDWLSLSRFLIQVTGRIVVGTLLVAIWRILAKRTCHTILPPIIRTVQPVFELPRRHYKKASEYINYSKRQAEMKAIPSIMELSGLPASLEDIAEVDTNGEPLQKPVRTHSGARSPPRKGRARSASEALARAMTPSPVHYDADVLTKLIVYTGIGLASHFVVYLFPMLGLA